jgi:hypothetical protein
MRRGKLLNGNNNRLRFPPVRILIVEKNETCDKLDYAENHKHVTEGFDFQTQIPSFAIKNIRVLHINKSMKQKFLRSSFLVVQHGETEILSETEDKTKPKEKRIEQKEKWDAETERSLAVYKFKEAHKMIEEMEKQRKRSALSSICRRIDVASDDFLQEAKFLDEEENYLKQLTEDSIQIFLANEEQVYKSIRFDFQKTLEIKGEDMQKLFPEIEVRKGISLYAGMSFLGIITQFTHMKAYWERMLA